MKISSYTIGNRIRYHSACSCCATMYGKVYHNRIKWYKAVLRTGTCVTGSLCPTYNNTCKSFYWRQDSKQYTWNLYVIFKSESTFLSNAPQFPRGYCFLEGFHAFPFVLFVRVTCKSFGASVGLYWQRKTELLREKLVPVPLCPPQILQRVIWHRTVIFLATEFAVFSLYTSSGF